MTKEQNCDECIWFSGEGCTSWDCECVTRSEARKIIEEWETLKKGGSKE